jgi:arginine/lysine/ornithine decarboxylase|tara:strand:+ start:73 stop:273 length:201 start_codon:yes stop_codon:yes gene_type:complete
MLVIILSLALSEQPDSTKIKATTNPTYNVMAYNMEDVKKKKKKGKKISGKGKKKKKGFFSKVFGSK